MTPAKRLLDLFFALLLVGLLGPVMQGLLAWLWIKQGRPLFYVAERMKTAAQPFMLWKLRPVTVVDELRLGRGMVRIGVTHWTIRPEPELEAEPIGLALSSSSR